MATNYFEKLKDPRWQKKRLEVFEAASFKCELCASEARQLHAHHKQYIKGRDPWDYEAVQLACLCDECHTEVHSEEDKYLIAGSFLPLNGPTSRGEVASLVAGFSGQDINSPQAHLCPDTYIVGELGFVLSKSRLTIPELVSLAEISKEHGEEFDALLRGFIRKKESKVM